MPIYFKTRRRGNPLLFFDPELERILQTPRRIEEKVHGGIPTRVQDPLFVFPHPPNDLQNITNRQIEKLLAIVYEEAMIAEKARLAEEARLSQQVELAKPSQVVDCQDRVQGSRALINPTNKNILPHEEDEDI